jgi:hypothetical protein
MMARYGNRDERRVSKILDRPRTAWALEQWAKTEVLHAADDGVDPVAVDAELSSLRTLVRDAKSGTVAEATVLDGLEAFVHQTGGWVSVGVWRLLHQFGPSHWCADERIRSWFIDGLRVIAPDNGGRQFPYQPYEDEEEFLRRAAGPDDPLWLFIPLRSNDLAARAVPASADEPPYTELPVGAERQIAIMTPRADSNIMFATRREPGSYVAVIDAPMSDDDPTRVRFDLTFADSLPDLYRRVGENLSIRGSVHWAHPELEPYFPYEYPVWRP